MFKNRFGFKKLTLYELCSVAMLIALTAVLSQVSGFLRIGNISKFSVSFISVYVAAVLYGPWLGGLVGALADVISFVANPTGGYIFWFTLIEFVNGFLFGVFFYRSNFERDSAPAFVLKAVLCSLAQLAVNMVLRTYILVDLGFVPMSFAKAFIVRLPASGSMAVLKVPVLVALESFVPRLVRIARKRKIAK